MAEEGGGCVVAGHVPVALFRVELESEAARVAFGVGGTFFAAGRGEAHEGGSFFADRVKKLGGGVFGQVRGGAEKIAVGAGALSVDDAFGDALTIEMGHLFKEQDVLKNHPAARSNGKGVLIVDHRT